MPSEYYAAIKYGYGIEVHNNIYTTVRETGKTTDTKMSVTALTAMYTEILKKTSFEKYAQYVDMFIPEFKQAPSSEDYIRSQYEVYGNVAKNKNEVMLVISKEDELSDLLLARLGYYTQDQFVNIVYKADNSDMYNEDNNVASFSYDELRGKKMYWYPNSVVFNETALGNSYSYNAYANDSWEGNSEALELTVVGILKPKQSVSYGSLSSGIYYTEDLTNYVLQTTANEVGGITNYVKGLDAETDSQKIYALAGAYATMRQGISYKLNYVYNGEQLTSTNYLSYLGNMGISAMLGGESTANDIKESIIRSLGGNSVANSVTIYPIDFDNKDLVTDYLKKWNGKEDLIVNGTTIKAADRQDVEYTDTLSLVIGLINTMIDIVSYALIAFTSVSLVVSTVMIGIITYVSVVERIKEIGVIRSLGGRKKDVSHLFNCETFIIGLLAGLIGVLATYGISAIVNAILFPLIGIEQIAKLPIIEAVILVLLSVLLTSISGLIPAKSAAKKDPVIALRTE
ncbi:MAG: ABC transporter permease [Clostridia bacterium]|nr:ABC transporter permease [Clostridia bacterium]